MVSVRVRNRSCSRACTAGTLAVACAAALSLAACISPPPQPTTPNTIQFQGPESVPGPAGTFSFSFTKVSGGTPQISVAAPQGMVCTLVGTTQVTYARSRGFVSSRSYCLLTADSDDGGQYIGQSMTVTVNVSAVSATSSASAAASAVAPAPAAAASSAAPQAAPATSAAQPSPKPTASKSASASASAAPSTAAAAPSTPSLSAQTVTWNPTTAISTTTASSYGGREFTPSTRATTSGNGAITYSVGSPNTSYCRVEGERTIVVGGNGVCTVIATAAATSQYSQGSTSVTFTISNWTDPRPAAPASSSPPVF